MNVVNEMVSDLDSRAGKTPVKKRNFSIPWQPSSVVVLVLGISTLSFTIWSFEREAVEDPMVQVAQFDKSAAKDNIPEMETLSKETNFIQKKVDDTPNEPSEPVDQQLVKNTKPDTPILKKDSKKQVTPIALSSKNIQLSKNSPLATINKQPVEKAIKKIQLMKKKEKVTTAKLTKEIIKTTNPIRRTIPAPAPKTISKPAKEVIVENKSDRVKLPPVLNSNGVTDKIVTPIKSSLAPEINVVSNQFRKKSIEFTRTQKAKKYYAEALVKLNGGNTALAKSLLQKALMTKKKHISARKLLAGIYINQKELVKAKKLLIEGIKQLPDASIFYHWLGRIYMEQGDFDQASVLLSDGSKYAKKGDYFALMALAQQNTDGFESAIESYQHALSLIPSQSKWWLGLGIVFEKIENWKEAETAYKTALLSENLPYKLHNRTTGRLTFVKNQLALLDD